MAALTAVGEAGSIVTFEGPVGGPGDVRVYDEASGQALAAPSELQGIRLLDIDFAGRTRLQEYLPGRPRRRLDVSGAARLQLPAQRGSLYHYARAVAGGGERFGYFRIAADGSLVLLAEWPGFGAAGALDPFLSRVAVAPQGDALLLATLPPAGGNLYEVDLASAALTDRTAGLPPLRFGGAGLALSTSTGVAVASAGILRFTRGAPGDASGVGFGGQPAPAWYSRELVASSNGQWFLTTAGSDAAHQLPWAFGASGDATALDSLPQTLSGAGFEPEATDGPYLAIRDDGQQAAWRIETATTREVLLAEVQQAPQVLSSSANFLDTLDEIGLAIFRPSGALHVAVGKSPLGVPNALESFDTYAVSLPASGGPSFTNLSLFSGDASAPFDTAPNVKARDWTLLPDGETLLVFDDQSAQGALYAVRPAQPGAQLVLDHVKSLDGLEPTARWMLIDMQRSDQGHAQELYRLPLSLAQPATLLVSLASGTNVSRFSARRDGWLAFVTNDAGGDTLWRALLPQGTLQAWNANVLPLGAALGMTSLGALSFSVDAPASAGTWPFGAGIGVALQVSPGPLQILPGL